MIAGVFWLASFSAQTLPARNAAARLGVAITCLCLGFAGLRELGLPISIALLAPLPTAYSQGLPQLGLIGVDLALGSTQIIAAIVLASTLTRNWLALKQSALLLTLVIAVVLITPDLTYPLAKPNERARIAVVQTSITPAERRVLSADGVLEAVIQRQTQMHRTAIALNPDLIIWPEGGQPGLTPPNRPGVSVRSSPPALRHHYRYLSPGRIQSRVSLEHNQRPSTFYDKRDPLPFAEGFLAQPSAPPAAIRDQTMSLDILICSEAIRPRAISERSARGASLIIAPSSTAFVGAPALGMLYRKAVQLEAARAKTPVLIVANGGSSSLISADGDADELLARYQRGVVAVTLKTPSPATIHAHHRASPWPWYLLAVAVVCAITAARITPPLDRQHSHHQLHQRWGIIIGLTGIVVAGSFSTFAPSTEHSVSAARSALGHPTYNAVSQKDQTFRGAIAMLGREFSDPVSWRSVPNGLTPALHWLCRRYGVIAAGHSARPPKPPALGLVMTDNGVNAIKWVPNHPPMQFDPNQLTMTSAANLLDRVRWLVAVDDTTQCHSAATTAFKTNGTGLLRPSD